MKRVIRTDDPKKYTGATWAELIQNIESKSSLKIDSVYRSRYHSHIVGYNSDGDEYEIEVTKYSDGCYEVMDSNIHLVG